MVCTGPHFSSLWSWPESTQVYFSVQRAKLTNGDHEIKSSAQPKRLPNDLSNMKMEWSTSEGSELLGTKGHCLSLRIWVIWFLNSSSLISIWSAVYTDHPYTLQLMSIVHISGIAPMVLLKRNPISFSWKTHSTWRMASGYFSIKGNKRWKEKHVFHCPTLVLDTKTSPANPLWDPLWLRN